MFLYLFRLFKSLSLGYSIIGVRSHTIRLISFLDSAKVKWHRIAPHDLS